MPPTVTDKTTRPTGVLPQNLRFIVLGAIAVFILISSFFSGQSTKKVTGPTTSPPAGPSPNQLSMFSEMLKREKLAAEAAKRQQAEALRLSQEQQQALAVRSATPSYVAAEPQRVVSPPPVDPFEQERRKREATAPFASNIAIRVPPSESEERANRQSSAQQPRQEGPKSNEEVRHEQVPNPAPKSQGSGKYLPEKENGLYRVYEGTFIETKR